MRPPRQIGDYAQLDQLRFDPVFVTLKFVRWAFYMYIAIQVKQFVESRVFRDKPHNLEDPQAAAHAAELAIENAARESRCASFLPSEEFTGARRGFVFKAGPKGLGYYRDQPGGMSMPNSLVNPSLHDLLKYKAGLDSLDR